MKTITKLIQVEETFALRKQMRPLRDLLDQRNPEDDLPTTFHIGTFIDKNLVGIASFSLEPHPHLKFQMAYRLRGMATEQSLKGSGIGRRTLEYGIEELKKRGCDLLWCNAREVAFGFYQKLKFSFLGEIFDIPTIGPHKVMYKQI